MRFQVWRETLSSSRMSKLYGVGGQNGFSINLRRDYR
jgi:hypothetical protein